MLNQSYFHTMKFNLGDYDLGDLGLGEFSLGDLGLGDLDLIPSMGFNRLNFGIFEIFLSFQKTSFASFLNQSSFMDSWLKSLPMDLLKGLLIKRRSSLGYKIFSHISGRP